MKLNSLQREVLRKREKLATENAEKNSGPTIAWAIHREACRILLQLDAIQEELPKEPTKDDLLERI